MQSELRVSKNCVKLLSKQTEILQRNALDSSQYLWREMIKRNLISEDMQDMQLEEQICKAFSLTSAIISPGDNEACHKMMQKDHVIIKFSSRKIFI